MYIVEETSEKKPKKPHHLTKTYRQDNCKTQKESQRL